MLIFFSDTHVTIISLALKRTQPMTNKAATISVLCANVEPTRPQAAGGCRGFKSTQRDDDLECAARPNIGLVLQTDVLVVCDIAVTGLPCGLARGREDSLPFPAPAEAPKEELGLVEHVVRDVEIKLSTFALLLTLPHARALPLSDDVGKYKLASTGMTNNSSLAAQKA